MAPEERPSVNVIRNVPSTTSSHLFPIFSKPGRRARVGGMKKKTRGSRMKRDFFYSWRRFRPRHALAPHAATETGQGHNYELTSTIRAIFYRSFEGPEGGRAWVLRKMDPHRSADLSTGQRGFIPPRLVWLHTSKPRHIPHPHHHQGSSIAVDYSSQFISIFSRPGRRAWARERSIGLLEFIPLWLVGLHTTKPRHIPHPTTTGGHQSASTIRAIFLRFFQGPEGGRAWAA